MKPRGIRNCNPLNIRRNPRNKWLGLRPVQTDPEFCQFKSMVYGVRAAFRLLLNYKKNGYDTARKVITRWAPPNENNTEGYIRTVALFLDVDTVIQKDEDYIRLAQAMAWVETGIQLSDSLMRQAWDMLWDEATFPVDDYRNPDHHEPDPAAVPD